MLFDQIPSLESSKGGYAGSGVIIHEWSDQVYPSTWSINLITSTWCRILFWNIHAAHIILTRRVLGNEPTTYWSCNLQLETLSPMYSALCLIPQRTRRFVNLTVTWLIVIELAWTIWPNGPIEPIATITTVCSCDSIWIVPTWIAYPVCHKQHVSCDTSIQNAEIMINNQCLLFPNGYQTFSVRWHTNTTT